MKRKLLSILALLMTAVTGAWADDYTITLPSVSNGSVVAKVSDVSVTSSAAGATVTLEATPDAGYRLKTISGVYSGTVSETFSSGANTRTGTYFSVSGSNYTYGWRVGNSYTLTISSLSNQNLSQVVLTVGTAPNVSQRNISHPQADHGTLSATGTTQGNTITITGINSPTVTVSAPGSSNAASMWTITQAKIDGLGNVALTLTDTGDDNVKTFTMPSNNVTISAEFELAPINVTANEGATGEYWATYYNSAQGYTADANTTVYQAAMNSAKTAVVLTEVTGREIPAGKGVVLKSSAATITLTPATTTQTLVGNELTGVDAATAAPSNAYCLSKETTGSTRGVGFYMYTGTIPAHRAYLVVAGGPSNARGFLGFGDDNNTTGISLPEAVVIEVDSPIYDLSGRRVTGQPQKGIYVKNGKKFIIK